tara:strand:+ start:11771 stop:12751 length:981 start_codon:yes stop_codon:yes gene_type:complete
MRAVIFEKPDGQKKSTVIKNVEIPVAGPKQVLIKVVFAGLNYADLMMRTGIYPHPKGYPLVAGLELSGIVDSVGLLVNDISVGDRVVAFSEDAGAFAEYCAVPSQKVVKLPDEIDFDVGAAFFVQAMTAWNLLHTISKTQRNDIVMIHAIGGGVGLYLTQLAKSAGAQVIGTVGTAGKERRALDFGADLVINRNDNDFIAVALEFTNGQGVDKIIDSTGASILDRSFEIIRPLGHVVSYGEAEGAPFSNLWEQLVKKSLTFTRMHLGHINFDSEDWIKGTKNVVSKILDGSLKTPIEGTYELDNVNSMFSALESRKLAGKVILKIL